MNNPLRTAGPQSERATSSRRSVTVRLLAALLLLYLLGFGLLSGDVSGNEPVNIDGSHSVVLFIGREENDPFWDLFASFMREAANDLGLEFEVFYANSNRRRMASQIREVCQRSDKPDVIVVMSFKNNGLISLRIAEQNKMRVFLVNAGLTKEQQEEIGEPRSKQKYWIGEMMPDDEGAGYQLAIALIDEARKDPQRLGSDGRVHLIGLNGVVSDGASIQRLAGLKRAIADRSEEAALDQVVAADWEQSLARLRCRILHRRYPQASVIWSASDLMAAGAIDAMRDRGITPGKDVIIGGVDATPEAMELIKQGTLNATIGGHFMEGGWVAVLLYDFLNGVDLKKIPTRYASPMTLVTRDNLVTYQAGLRPSTWMRTNFRHFSRLHHPELASYDFSLSNLANASQAEQPATHTGEGIANEDSDSQNE